MIEPNTGNEHLDRMLMWFRLIEQISRTYDHRSPDVRSSIGDAVLNMGNVTTGYSIVSGDYCLSACCALGAAASHPWFNARGLRPAFAPGAEFKLDGLHVVLESKRLMFSGASLAEFFGLSWKDYVSIVEPECYDKIKVSPSDVLSRMTKVIQSTFNVDPLSRPFIEKILA